MTAMEKSPDVPDASDANDEAPPAAETEQSFRRKHFEREEDIWGIAAPISILDLTVEKDLHKKADGSDDDDGSSLPGAPNFVTAIIGRWLAEKLGCMGPKPQSLQDTDHTSSSQNSKSKSNHVISKISLVLNPGEATLIIAPSSSGKSTLMRTIVNVTENSSNLDMSKISGTIKIGGCDPTDPKYKGCFRRSTAYADQGDLTLTPILTVSETLKFTGACANKCTEEELETANENYLKLAGLSHVAGTVVGNAEIRGVSGGQKRRVKVLEQATGQDIRVLCLDEITNGLDSASALASCQNVSVAVAKTGVTALVSLLQPSVEAYSEFHRIVVLTSHGEMAYSGPRDKALDYFRSLGFVKPDEMDEPEFILRCAFKPEEFIAEADGVEASTKLQASDLPGMFAESSAGKLLMQEVDTAESTRAKEEPRSVPPFARSFNEQCSLLLSRGWKLVVRNPGSFIRVIIAILFGLIVGTLFLKTPGDANGTTTRAGFAFTMLMLLFMTAANSPMEGNYLDRVTFYCHRESNFYSTKAYYIATMITSWPVCFLEVFFLSICTFFLVGMASYGGSGFAYFWLISLLISFCGLSLSRVLSYALPSNDVAAALGPAVLLLFTMTAGFAPQYPSIPAWLRWISWLSPCAYAFEGIIINDLRGRSVEDVDGLEFAQEAFSLPRIPFDQAVSGLNTAGGVMAFDAYIIVIFTVLFEILGCILLHHSQKWYGPSTKRYQVTSGMSLTAASGTKHLLKGKKAVTPEIVDKSAASGVPLPLPIHLRAKDIVYEVDVDVPIEPKDTKEKTGEDDKEEDPDEEDPGVAKAFAGERSQSAERSMQFPVESDLGVPITAREYGQARKGAAQALVLRRALGEEALASNVGSSSASTSIRFDSISAAEANEATTGHHLEPPEPGRLRLLSGVTATFEPGTMTALMGSSGAGKSTLLDVLAGYKTGGHIDGDISLNNAPKDDATWKLVAGYCEQTDLHNPAITVRESLMFAARMRLRPFSLAEDARVGHVEDILKLLELEEFADVLVGDEGAGEGLPKHARKRLTLGVELAANGSILFADEPTSGLDSLSASLVVSSLRRAAKAKGVTVVCTIHQPSKEVFAAFDNLLLLRKGGVCVYNGPVSGIDEYIVSTSGDESLRLKAGANPADHVLDILCGPGGERFDWGSLYTQSSMAKGVSAIAHSCSCDECKAGGVGEVNSGEERGIFSELFNVLQRQVIAHYRTPTYMSVRFWWTISASLLTGFIFMGLSNTSDGAFNLVGAAFSFVNIGTVPLMSASVPLIMERAVYYREVTSGTYRKITYAAAVEIAEIPFNLFMAAISWILFYFLVGLDLRADRVIYNLLMTLAAYWILPLFGQLFSFLSPNIGIAAVLGGIVLVLFTLTMGFLIAPQDIPPWWIWVYWLNPLRYILQGIAVNELGDGKEYVVDGTDEYVSGDVLLEALGGWSFSQRWWYCYIVVLLFGFAASGGLMLATRINWMKR